MGNRTEWIEIRGTTVTTHDSDYTDPAHAHGLTKVTTGADPSVQDLTYDQVGNTTSITDPADTRAGQEITCGVEGHETDVKDKATGKHTSYVYDADGNRLLKHDEAASSTTLYVGASEYTAKSGAVQCVRNYAVGDEPVATRDASGLTVIIGDSQHTGQLAINGTTMLVDKRRFAPFGTDLDAPTSAWPNSHGYLDKTTDTSTGTTHLGAREYDPNLGRFLSVDPVLDTGDPQQMNGYAYANNSPITMTDPTGKLFAPGDGRVPTCGTGRTCRDNGYTPTPKHVWDSLQNRHVPTKAEIHAANLAAAEAAMQKWKDEQSGDGFLGMSGNTWKKIGIGAGIVGTAVAVTVLTGGSGDFALAAALEGTTEVAGETIAETAAEETVADAAGELVNISSEGKSLEEVNALTDYAQRTNAWLNEVGPKTVQSTAGSLRSEASAAARAERLSAERAGTPYAGQAGHVPDAALSGEAVPPAGWLDMPGVSNQAAGGVLGSRIGTLVRGFTIDGGLP